MRRSNLFDRCKFKESDEIDTFVGVRILDSIVEVCLPHGYNISKVEKELRHDILNLMRVIYKFSNKSREFLSNEYLDDKKQIFPFSSCLFLIEDYLKNGYFFEKYSVYKSDKKGKVNWQKTIKTENVIFDEQGPIFLSFKVLKSELETNDLISNIHRYCVYISFFYFGWLYTSYMPNPSPIKFNKKLFLSILKEKKTKIFNDDTLKLINAMINIVEFYDIQQNSNTILVGTNRFEYIWEYMVDYMFGIENKDKYFPKTYWEIFEDDDRPKKNSLLQPDTIMVDNDDIFVLDAKYYRYGVTRNVYHLPNSSSINKQITYGEFAYKQHISEENCLSKKVFNAFIMPYDKKGNLFNSDSNYLSIGIATSEWKTNHNSFENVVGILVDTKYFINNLSKNDIFEIKQLASQIRQTLEQQRGGTTTSPH